MSHKPFAHLVLVQLTVLVLLLSLLLECNNDKTDKDVHHKEGDDDDIDDKEDRDDHTVVVDGTSIFSMGVYGFVQEAEDKNKEHVIGA